jgi:hypothetical protein
MINASYWLEKGVEIVFERWFLPYNVPTHCSSSFSALFTKDGPPDMSHTMARIHQERLLERHYLLPHKMARAPRIDEVKGTSSRVCLRNDVTPLYGASRGDLRNKRKRNTQETGKIGGKGTAMYKL